MSGHRFCATNDRDGFIEKLAQELWEEKEAFEGERGWYGVDVATRQRYLNLAADALRFLEHGHG